MNVEQHLLSLEDKRCSALLHADLPALERLLSERLVFTHANARSDSKREFLEKMRSGQIVYAQIATSESRVIALNDSVIIFSRFIADIMVAGSPKRVDNRTLSVWACEDGEFRLVAYQPTPVHQ